MPARAEVVVSGMRPTGRLHLGNYWGALRNWIALAEAHKCYFFVADWHMLTTGYEDTSKLKENSREMVLDWLAAGLDPKKCVIFRQSDVPEHAELAFILGALTPLSWLENNPTWKEQLQELSKIVTNAEVYKQNLKGPFSAGDFKSGLGEASSLKERWVRGESCPSGRHEGGFTCSVNPARFKDFQKWDEWDDIVARQASFVGSSEGEIRLSSEISVILDSSVPPNVAHWRFHWLTEGHKEINTSAFLGYPILQAADILIYHGTKVPVGKDQLPHLELSREIARRFNRIYDPVLSEPQPLLTPTPKVSGLDGRKMSKSYDNAINLYETEESLKKKIMAAYTDPTRIKATDPGHPDPCAENPPGCSIFALHKLYAGADFVSRRDKECRAGQIGCVACKKDLLSEMEPAYAKFRKTREGFAAKPGLVEQILEDGAKKARAVAQETMKNVRRAMRIA